MARFLHANRFPLRLKTLSADQARVEVRIHVAARQNDHDRLALGIDATGKQSRKSFEPVIGDRKAYFDEWNKRIEEMPIVLGTPPETIADPVVIEIFGITDEFLERMRTGSANLTQLSGVPASSGVARGIARVLRSPDELPRLQQGDVLVCVGTTPTWTPAFTKISACVCDGGGTLTHASVVSREYRVPCVVGTGLATQAIKDGDEVTVDGDKGLVTVHRAG